MHPRRARDEGLGHYPPALGVPADPQLHTLNRHPLAKAKVDWQLWVRTGGEPLPMKYVITSKWVTGAPQYSARFRDWNTKPEIGADRFVFTPPEGVKKLDQLLFDGPSQVCVESE